MELNWEDDTVVYYKKQCAIWQQDYDIKEIYKIPKKVPQGFFLCYIYRIINISNRKSYIGQAKRNVFKRWEEHLFRDNSAIFHSDLHTFNILDFAFKIEEVFLVPDKFKKELALYWFMQYRELNFIIKYDCYENGYNTHNIEDEKNNPFRIRQNKKYHIAGGNKND